MASSPERAGLKGRGFSALLWTQGLGAFNDNSFKTLIALMAVALLPPGESAKLVALSGALFILPFIVFSTYAGALADRYSKKKLIVLFKAIELLLLVLSFFALYLRNIPSLLALLFLMGAHSAFFSPLKLAILPEILEDKNLSHGNGLMQACTFAGIILGTMAAGLLMQTFEGRLHLASLLFVAAAVLGLLASLGVAEVPPSGGREPFRLNFVSHALENLRAVRGYLGVYEAVIGSAYFWFLGAIFQMNLLVYGKELMGVTETTLSGFQIVVAFGIGLGSYAAGRLSREKVELGLVPLGALGLVAFSVDLAFSFRSVSRTVVDLFGLGACGGLFVLPLQAYIQQRSPPEERGKVIATSNILSFVGVLIASGCLWAFSVYFKLHAGQVFLVTAAMTLVAALYIVRMLPDFLLRLFLYPMANLLYRIQAEGAGNLPLTGPALLISNHVSFVDAFLIGGATSRRVRFLMFRRYYDLPVLRWFFKAMGALPISEHDSPKAILQSFESARQALREGRLVCIFAEGEVTRHGQMLRFKKGFERIVKGLDVPIVPVHLDRVWGSIFSYEGGRVLLKWPRRLPYPVTVSFGKPLPSTATAPEARQAILSLGAEAFQHRLAEKRTLPVAFLREAKRHPWRLALADSMGGRLRYGSALLRALALGRTLDRMLPPGEAVGVLLPPSVPAALVNLGLGLVGRVPINLNYTASREIALECARKAGIRRIVTSARVLEKLGWEAAPEWLPLEDAAPRVSKLWAAAAAAPLFLLPSFAAVRLFAGKARRPTDSLATVIFTSGSTGIPKGVMLTHANIQANIEALAQVYQVGPSDRILGALPFFHSFGYTVTLWFPLLTGSAAVYHPNPLDAKRIGDLAEEHRATFLLGTPTFLLAYLRRVEPEKFKSLRYVVAGAEKLREEVALAFEERFGLKPLEGYGCTELSPCAAVNVPDIAWPGVRQKGTKPGTIGQPLPGVLMKVVDPETGEEVPEGGEGLLLVKGPNVMKGYLGEPAKTAEVLRDGFYVTGDIAAIDPDGFVTITDRLSRFSKIGGEMVPHIKVEEKLHELAGLVDPTFAVTSVPDSKRGERLVVLCRGYEDLDGISKRLARSDLPKLWVPDRSSFFPVVEFPLLGSGKLDLQKLKSVAREMAP